MNPTPPTVACVMLTRDRLDMTRRAVRCFQRQTISARLMIFDNGIQPTYTEAEAKEFHPALNYFHVPSNSSIGALRNQANAFTDADIVAHFDSDDYSHPNRLAEQVALLQSSGADAVGYGDMLFWRLRDLDEPGVAPGESWLYHQQHPTFCLGTSLCYWRSTWERKPFPDRSDGEDFWWQQGLQTCAVSSLPSEPRMIATIHGSNAGQKHYDGLLGSHQAYERVPHWDDHCRKTLEAA